MKRDGIKESLWEESVPQTHTNSTPITAFDTIIVGAGITGITLAYELQKRGRNCLILEQKNVGFGTTGGTTAHINNFLDESYDQLISKFGEEKAQTVANYAKSVAPQIKRNIEANGISCEFAECKFYLFSAEEKQDKMLEDILEAHEKLGVTSREVSEIPFDISFRKAIEIDGQAQFHPLKYISGLTEVFENLGGIIITDAHVSDHETKDGIIEIKTENGKIFSAKNLVWATHIPPGINRFSILNAAYRSFALAATLSEAPPKMAQAADLYDPYHYFRYHQSGNQNYLIVGGFDHKTGHEKEGEKPFEDLVNYVQENFKFDEIVAQWSSQYYIPSDGLPYIGVMPGEKNVYIATGYNGNGMTWGTLAADIIADLIENKKNPLAEVVAPSRIEILASAKDFLKENVDTAFHFVKDRFSAEKKEELENLGNGQGKVISYDGEDVAAHRDFEGNLKLISAKCPHMGCTVQFNQSEQTWDCPCHGSRFDKDGYVLNSPALQGLKAL